MYLVFTGITGDSCHRRFGSFLLCSCDVFRALINSLCLLILHKRSKHHSVSDCNDSETFNCQIISHL